MKFLLRTASVMALTLGATACQTPVPQVLGPQHVPSNFTAPTARNAPVWPSAGWWAGFGSPELNGYITTAQTNNLDLAAAARVLQAQAQTEISGSALLPSLSLQGEAQRARNGAGQIVLDPTTGQPTGQTRAATGNTFGLT